MTLSVILPAYNEARRLPASLSRCAEFFRSLAATTEIIVADDGSTDDTRHVVGSAALELASPRFEVHYLPLPHRGKGAAVRAGILAARGDPVLFLDADLTIPVEVVDRLLDALRAGADIAVASRYVPGSVVRRPLLRRSMSHAFRALVRVLVPTGLEDTQCGGKAYTAEAARALFTRQYIDGFAFDAEVLYLATRHGYRVTEVPFVLGDENDSSVRLLADIPRMIRDLIRIRIRATRGGYR
ncbi:MAG: glycosyltransferase family 2 protein [Chloroflexi bacterium]|nr:glycosyltransferase family 2 protein [Chloroflexota bacterium]